MQQIIDLWNLLQKDLVTGKSLHGSGGEMDKHLEGKSTVNWYGNQVHFRKVPAVKLSLSFKI